MGEQLAGKAGGGRFKMFKGMTENLFIIILAFYPLRHVYWGLDLMDTGYNYANYTYMGTEHMDPMWLFSVWLSNAVGHWLTRLPGGGQLVGMNIYTGLFVSLLALAGYWFCTRKLRIRPWIAFLGEMAAVSLCWCPTALLYNYMTYVLFLGCFILLYLGLTKDRKEFLIGAGVCLGANVLVRFSNLPEAAMILAVWVYDFLCAREEKQSGAAQREGLPRKILRHTGWCLLGYLAALVVLFGCIDMKYGMGEYVKGISRLFGMTDVASDYKAVSMIINILKDYTQNLYWVIRIVFFPAVGVALSAAAGLIKGKAAVLVRRGVQAVCVILSVAMAGWLYYRGADGQKTPFCTLDFCEYASMWRPALLFLMLTLFIAAVRVFHPKSRKEDRLVGGMLILVIFLTAIGSNNRTYPSINNLFIAAPYTLQACRSFLKEAGDKKIARVTISPFPVKCALSVFLLLCCFQFAGFGMKFVFAEAGGVRDISGKVDNNEVLKNVKLSGEKAEWMSSLSAYVNESGLQGQEVILYGTPLSRSIPALSFYLQMPSAFNPWINLGSYSYAVFEEDMRELEGKTPVVILEDAAALYEEGGEGALTRAGISEATIEYVASDEKLQAILNFMEQSGYVQTFRNEKFGVYRCAESR
ncbi:MAG: hypothetical protein NC123_05770 [Butyrivibrio sp.]|nr:hypothetical protein [Acetatifactor muris]MCM1559036.1 hypothetical protein [Butyrivibrio sp.]